MLGGSTTSSSQGIYRTYMIDQTRRRGGRGMEGDGEGIACGCVGHS